MESAQPEDSSCCWTATAMKEVQISEQSDTAGVSEDERSPPQSAHSGRRSGSAARASVIRNRIIQKKYLQRKKVPLLALPCRGAACTFTHITGPRQHIITSITRSTCRARRCLAFPCQAGACTLSHM